MAFERIWSKRKDYSWISFAVKHSEAWAGNIFFLPQFARNSGANGHNVLYVRLI